MDPGAIPKQGGAGSVGRWEGGTILSRWPVWAVGPNPRQGVSKVILIPIGFIMIFCKSKYILLSISFGLLPDHMWLFLFFRSKTCINASFMVIPLLLP